ncbi:hypothetical protein FIBSPDRAFT_603178 [Athelia psychrophila]|uniref:Uncharacterized protein n=1 Tax=Athelia psychrophila TaxID=1759441 RepID=A0A166GQP9_9AGAM|nr:hypothetical protein FIBSPDRAFT_603178 [Fibularhizoctonia sp. CBS 109695]
MKVRPRLFASRAFAAAVAGIWVGFALGTCRGAGASTRGLSLCGAQERMGKESGVTRIRAWISYVVATPHAVARPAPPHSKLPSDDTRLWAVCGCVDEVMGTDSSIAK